MFVNKCISVSQVLLPEPKKNDGRHLGGGHLNFQHRPALWFLMSI